MSRRGEADDGRIPFRIRIGVTGHRDLERSEALRVIVRDQVRRINGLLSAPETSVHLAAVSQLAEGADRLVAWEVLEEGRERGHEARLEALLPFEREQYEEAQGFDGESREEFNRLFELAVVRREERGARVESAAERTEAFEAASRQLVGRCDVLIALWNGRESGGRGGTASTLLYAASSAKPCIWIATEELTVRDNLSPGQVEDFYRKVAARAFPGADAPSLDGSSLDALAGMRESFNALDEFNREAIDLSDAEVSDELVVEPESGRWVAAPFARASELAARWQSRFKWMARTITLFATLAAVMLAAGLAFYPEEPRWTVAEAALFFLALVGSYLVRRVGFHRRWLSYRVLAERLRSARFLAPTGADFRRQARLEAVFTGGRSTAWLMRAFEEVWDRRPPPPIPVDRLGDVELDRFKRFLADDWIGSQIAYHKKKSAHHRRWHRRLTSLVVLLFAATIAFAILHSKHIWEEASVFFSIALPAAGASLGVLLTVNQHQALSERYARMKSDLTVARRNLLDAPPDSLDRVSSEAARVIAQETGAWFGSMWFLDIEHP